MKMSMGISVSIYGRKCVERAECDPSTLEPIQLEVVHGRTSRTEIVAGGMLSNGECEATETEAAEGEKEAESKEHIKEHSTHRSPTAPQNSKPWIEMKSEGGQGQSVKEAQIAIYRKKKDLSYHIIS